MSLAINTIEFSRVNSLFSTYFEDWKMTKKMVVTASLADGAVADNYRKNPFTLTYSNAITENAAGKVNIHAVTYQLHSIKIATNVYTMPNYDPAKNTLL